MIVSLHPLLKERGNIDSVAQLVEHYTFNVRVLGPSPSGITETKTKTCKTSTYRFFLFYDVNWC